VRYGYRCVHVLLCRERWAVNIKRVYRLYHEICLQFRNKTPKRRSRRSCGKTVKRRKEQTRHGPWTSCVRHQGDACASRLWWMLLSLLACDRFEVHVSRRKRCSSHGRICRRTGYPKAIRVDQRSEFARDLDLWAYQYDVVFDFSRPGKPADDAFIEFFNGKFRAECLNAHWFMSLEDARERMEAWRRVYNEGSVQNLSHFWSVACSG
jgi:putative transposase